MRRILFQSGGFAPGSNHQNRLQPVIASGGPVRVPDPDKKTNQNEQKQLPKAVWENR
jgi:hypothetical protein